MLQAAERSIDTSAEAGSGSWGALAEAYLKGHAYLKGQEKRSAAEDERMLGMQRMWPWENRPAESITSAEVRQLLDSVAATAPYAANRLRALLHTVFNFGIEKEIVESNPVTKVKRPMKKEKERERVFSEAELRKLWASFDAEPAYIASAFRLLLITGCRKSEVAKIQPAEIEGADWTLPAARSKNGKSYVVPLSPYALSLTREIGRGFNVQRAFHRVLDLAGIEDGRCHDLRRSAATYWGKIGIAPHIIDRLLNHAPATITTKHYERWSYATEKREALAKWENELLRIVGGETVVMTGGENREARV